MTYNYIQASLYKQPVAYPSSTLKGHKLLLYKSAKLPHAVQSYRRPERYQQKESNITGSDTEYCLNMFISSDTTQMYHEKLKYLIITALHGYLK